MAEKILITPITLRNQNPTDIKECYIELHEKHLHYKVEFTASEPINENDHDLGWEDNIPNNFDIIALKEKISGVEKSITKDKKWGVYIIVSGFTHDIKVYHRSQTQAQQLFDKIYDWLIKE